MAPLNVAILGAGIFAREAHLPSIAAIAESSDIKLTAVYSRSHGSASALAELAQKTLKHEDAIRVYSDSEGDGLGALLAQPDVHAVIVVLPITQQPDVILRALKAGKHVLSEKPVGKDVQTGLELVQAYENEFKPKGLVWRVAENFECEPGIQAVKQIIQSGKIGKVTWFKLVSIGDVQKDNKWYQTAWRTVPDYQGGFLLDGGVHQIALLRTVLGPIVGLSGFASLAQEHLLPHDTITSVLQTSSGAHGILELGFGSPIPSRNEAKVTITGTDGYVELTSEKRKASDGSEKQHWVVKSYLKDQAQVEGLYPQAGVEKEIEYFAEAIRGSNDAVVLATNAPRGTLQDVAVIQASLTSSGAFVDIRALVSN